MKKVSLVMPVSMLTELSGCCRTLVVEIEQTEVDPEACSESAPSLRDVNKEQKNCHGALN